MAFDQISSGLAYMYSIDAAEAARVIRGGCDTIILATLLIWVASLYWIGRTRAFLLHAAVCFYFLVRFLHAITGAPEIEIYLVPVATILMVLSIVSFWRGQVYFRRR